MLKPSAAYLKALATYIEQGLSVVINKAYPFEAFKTAYTDAPKAHIIGKAVITVD